MLIKNITSLYLRNSLETHIPVSKKHLCAYGFFSYERQMVRSMTGIFKFAHFQIFKLTCLK